MSANWIGDLADKHKGQAGFVIGNGWSVQYYDIPKLKDAGVLIGCKRFLHQIPQLTI